jgi:hypothetical protein
MILKQVIKYTNANAIEATWVERATLPDVIIPANQALFDADGNVVTEAIPEQILTNQFSEVVVKCHSYADVQMQMFRDDVAAYGGDITQYEALIAEVEAAHVPVPPAPPVIPSCSPRQIRQVLTAVGLRTAVEDAVAAGSQDLRDWWEFSTIIERHHPEVIAMGAALGQTPEALDALFTAGAAL